MKLENDIHNRKTVHLNSRIIQFTNIRGFKFSLDKIFIEIILMHKSIIARLIRLNKY